MKICRRNFLSMLRDGTQFGARLRSVFRQIRQLAADWALALRPELPISLLVGEMPGRAEGGVKDRQPHSFCK
jgi:hypothetical protein